jgi:hypothetical protein
MRWLLVLVLIAGCTSVSEVVPYGNGTYIVSASDSAGHYSSGQMRVEAAKAANDYCSKQGKKMRAVEANERGDYWSGPSSSLVFACD